MKTYTVTKNTTNYNPYKDIMIQNPNQLGNTQIDNYNLANPFADIRSNPYIFRKR